MNLSDFARYIDPAVVHRGKEYVSEGRVISLKALAEGTYIAVVRGYDDYEVYVELDDEGGHFGFGMRLSVRFRTGLQASSRRIPRA